MVEFQFITPIFTVFVWFLSYIKFGSIISPVSIVASWWCLWLFVANFSLTGIYIPRAPTQTLVLVMLFAMLCGSILATTRAKSQGTTALLQNRNLHKRWRYLYLAIGVFSPAVAYYFSKAISIFLSEGVLGYRDAVFGNADRPSVLFESNYVEWIYALVVSPIIFSSLIAGVVFYLSFRDRKLLAVSLVMIAMDAVLRLGRFNFYFFLFFLFFSYLLLRQRSRFPDATGNYFRIAVKKVRVTVGGCIHGDYPVGPKCHKE